jgi:hypothetical protein
MLRRSLGYIALIGVLLAAVGLSQWFSQPTLGRSTQSTASQDLSLYSFHVDVAGWYEATPNETVVQSRYDLSRTALPDALPTDIDIWRSVELGTNGDIETWFENPDLVMRRRFENERGHIVWLTAIGSQGPKSFRIFEHTPLTCYPSAEWTRIEHGVHHVPVGDGRMAVQRGVFERQQLRRLVYYWYQWSSPSRDAAQGVTSWRLTTDILDGDTSKAEACLEEWVALLFEKTIPFHRF